jgi:ComF family protein
MRDGFIELMYPKTCAGCGMRGTWLCAACERSLPKLDVGICYRCGAPVQPICGHCADLDRSVSMARSAYPYASWVPNAVKAFKYGDEWSRGPDLAARMVSLADDLGPVDVVVPVPLHAERVRMRGYNQSQLLAEGLARELGALCVPVVSRIRSTLPQVALDRESRQGNVRGAFALDPSYSLPPGLRFLLVDDVRTTCSTINACAQVLTQVVPARISVATFALDLRDRELLPWLDEYAR